jgi:hypothetical protein
MVSNLNHNRISLAVILALQVSIGAGRAANYSGAIGGVVKDATGRPVVGATVKATDADRGISFMVVSQERGQYRIGNLPAGKYTLLALGAGMESDDEAVS